MSSNPRLNNQTSFLTTYDKFRDFLTPKMVRFLKNRGIYQPQMHKINEVASHVLRSLEIDRNQLESRSESDSPLAAMICLLTDEYFRHCGWKVNEMNNKVPRDPNVDSIYDPYFQSFESSEMTRRDDSGFAKREINAFNRLYTRDPKSLKERVIQDLKSVLPKMHNNQAARVAEEVFQHLGPIFSKAKRIKQALQTLLISYRNEEGTKTDTPEGYFQHLRKSLKDLETHEEICTGKNFVDSEIDAFTFLLENHRGFLEDELKQGLKKLECPTKTSKKQTRHISISPDQPPKIYYMREGEISPSHPPLWSRFWNEQWLIVQILKEKFPDFLFPPIDTLPSNPSDKADQTPFPLSDSSPLKTKLTICTALSALLEEGTGLTDQESYHKVVSDFLAAHKQAFSEERYKVLSELRLQNDQSFKKAVETLAKYCLEYAIGTYAVEGIEPYTISNIDHLSAYIAALVSADPEEIMKAVNENNKKAAETRWQALALSELNAIELNALASDEPPFITMRVNEHVAVVVKATCETRNDNSLQRINYSPSALLVKGQTYIDDAIGISRYRPYDAVKIQEALNHQEFTDHWAKILETSNQLEKSAYFGSIEIEKELFAIKNPDEFFEILFEKVIQATKAPFKITYEIGHENKIIDHWSGEETCKYTCTISLQDSTRGHNYTLVIIGDGEKMEGIPLGLEDRMSCFYKNAEGISSSTKKFDQEELAIEVNRMLLEIDHKISGEGHGCPAFQKLQNEEHLTLKDPRNTAQRGLATQELCLNMVNWLQQIKSPDTLVATIIEEYRANSGVNRANLDLLATAFSSISDKTEILRLVKRLKWGFGQHYNLLQKDLKEALKIHGTHELIPVLDDMAKMATPQPGSDSRIVEAKLRSLNQVRSETMRGFSQNEIYATALKEAQANPSNASIKQLVHAYFTLIDSRGAWDEKTPRPDTHLITPIRDCLIASPDLRNALLAAFQEGIIAMSCECTNLALNTGLYGNIKKGLQEIEKEKTSDMEAVNDELSLETTSDGQYSSDLSDIDSTTSSDESSGSSYEYDSEYDSNNL